MNPITLKTDVLNNLPWQARPTDCTAPLWRYQENPDYSPESDSGGCPYF